MYDVSSITEKEMINYIEWLANCDECASTKIETIKKRIKVFKIEKKQKTEFKEKNQ